MNSIKSLNSAESGANSDAADTSPRVEVPDRPFYRKKEFWIGMCGMLITGSTNPLFSKASYLQQSYPCSPEEDCELQSFDGYIVTSILKYVWLLTTSGIVFWGVEYGLYYKKGKVPIMSTAIDIEHSLKAPWIVYSRFLLTAFIDTWFTLLACAATVYTRSSICAVLGAFQIITAAFADMVISRRALTTGKVIGLIVIIAGMVVFGVGASILEDENDAAQAPKPILGAVLAFISSICRGVQSSLQTRNMRKFRFPPILMVFIESCFALIFTTIIALIGNAVDVYDLKGEFWMFTRNWKICLLLTVCCAESFLFNGGAAIIGKYVSGLFRMIWSRSISFLLWVFELSLQWSEFSFLTLLGWIVLLSGVVIYAGIHPKVANKAPWFFYPLLCCKRLDPPENAILSKKQQEALKNRESKAAAEADMISSANSKVYELSSEGDGDMKLRPPIKHDDIDAPSSFGKAV